MLLILAAAAASMVETPVTASANPALHGTLLAPSGAITAAAVIIPGSGPTDRNGDQPGMRTDMLRLLARGLADHGIATIRFDKRGVGESASAAADEVSLRFLDYAADVRAWVVEAAVRTGRRCVWLIGHSEGSLVALAAVARDPERVCGLVLLAGAGRPAAVVLREQLRNLPEPLRAKAEAILSELEHGRLVDVPPVFAPLFRREVQPYILSLLPLDPASLIRGYRGPVMIGQGTTDLQVGMADAEALAAAQPRARLVRFEGVNHLLKVAPADRAANLAVYGRPDLPLAPRVVGSVAAFILDRHRRRPR